MLLLTCPIMSYFNDKKIEIKIMITNLFGNKVKDHWIEWKRYMNLHWLSSEPFDQHINGDFEPSEITGPRKLLLVGVDCNSSVPTYLTH